MTLRSLLLLLALAGLVGSCTAAAEPPFRPAGGRVLYSQRGQDLWSSSPDGTGQRQVSFDGASSGDGYTGGRYSPDGRLVAAERNHLREDGTGLYLLDPETRASVRLSQPGTFIDGYAWSPDGRYIVFGELRSGGNPGPGGGVGGAVGDVVLYDVAARAPRVLAPGTHPSFSPDGRLVGFAHAAGSVATIDVASGALVHLATAADLSRWSAATAPRGIGIVGGPVWSADGRQIAFAAIENGPVLEALQIIYVQEPVAGAPPKQWVIGKTGAIHHVAELRWAPSRPLLGYSLINAQPHHHWVGVIDPAKGERRELHDSVAHFVDFTWSPTGDSILVQLDDEDAWAFLRPGQPGIAFRKEPGGWRPDWCRCD